MLDMSPGRINDDDLCLAQGEFASTESHVGPGHYTWEHMMATASLPLED